MRKATSVVASIQLPVWEVMIGMLPNEEGNERHGEQLPSWEVMIEMLPNVEGNERHTLVSLIARTCCCGHMYHLRAIGACNLKNFLSPCKP